MRSCILVIILLMSVHAFAQTSQYTVSSIPDSLKQNTSAVFRVDEATLNVLSPSQYIYTVHQVITLLSADAEKYLHHKVGTSKFYLMEDAAIKMIDQYGIIEKIYKKTDFDTEAAYDGVSFVTDTKVMSLFTPARSYPCTIDINYTIKSTGYLELPDWYITNNASTELFRYTVSVPESIDIRHRVKNMVLQPTLLLNNYIKTYTWEKRNIKAALTETSGNSSFIQVAPNVFEYDGYAGSFASWKSFGAWNYDLYQEKEPFTKSRIEEIQELIKPATNTKEKIKVLYDYLKNNMRYVSIQLGIGGFKPFPSKYVDEKKYGDCKALTNYMRNLLAVAGIKSYPALVNSGVNAEPVDPTFPYDPFDHVILCVPSEKDTTWLECTSNAASAGYLGTFTENRYVLLLTERGGELVKTPQSNYRTNATKINTSISVSLSDKNKVSQTIYSSGDDRSLFHYLLKNTIDNQKNILTQYLKYKPFEELNISEKDDSLEYLHLELELQYDKVYEFKAGSKYFFPLHLNRFVEEKPKDEKRMTDYVIDHPYTKTEIIRLLVSDELKIESIPENVTIDIDPFYYSRKIISKTNNLIEIEITATIKKNVIEPALYPTAVAFFTTLHKEDSKKIILVSN